MRVLRLVVAAGRRRRRLLYSGAAVAALLVVGVSVALGTPAGVTAISFSATVGVSTTTRVGTFQSAPTQTDPSDYTAVIQWGDGTTSPGTIDTIVAGTPPTFEVVATHTYAAAGSYMFNVVVIETLDHTRASATGTATVLPPPPDATTGSSLAHDTYAQVGGTVDAHGQSPTTYAFKYGPSAAYGTSTPQTFVPSGTGPQAVVATLMNLTPLTTYHYRVVAVGPYGTTQGADATFTTTAATTTTTTTTTTPSGPGAPFGTPIVTSLAPVPNPSQHVVELRGTVNPNGVYTRYMWQYGTSPAYGQETPIGYAGFGTQPRDVGYNLAGYTAGATLYDRLVATTPSGRNLYGDPQSVTAGWQSSISLDPPALTSPDGIVDYQLVARADDAGEDSRVFVKVGTNPALTSTTPPLPSSGHLLSGSLEEQKVATSAGFELDVASPGKGASYLLPDTTYYAQASMCELHGVNGGCIKSSVVSFKTPHVTHPPIKYHISPQLVVTPDTITEGHATTLDASGSTFTVDNGFDTSALRYHYYLGGINYQVPIGPGTIPNDIVTTPELKQAGDYTANVIASLPNAKGQPSALSIDVPFRVQPAADLRVIGMDVYQAAEYNSKQGLQYPVEGMVTADPVPPLHRTFSPDLGLVLPGPVPANLDTSLVAGKKTVVRVYADLTKSFGTAAAKGLGYGGYLSVWAGSTHLGDDWGSSGGAIAYGAGSRPDAGLTTQQATSKDGLTFVLPAAWTSAGPLRIVAHVLLDQLPSTLYGNLSAKFGPPSAECPSCDANNAYTLDGVTFNSTRGAVVNHYESCAKAMNGHFGGCDFGFRSDYDSVNYADAQSMAPMSDGYPDINGTSGGMVNIDNAYDDAAGDFAGNRTKVESTLVDDLDEADGSDHGDFTALFENTGLDTAGTTDHPQNWASFAHEKVHSNLVITPTRPRTSMAHETGHAIGRPHASACGGGAADKQSPTYGRRIIRVIWTASRWTQARRSQPHRHRRRPRSSIRRRTTVLRLHVLLQQRRQSDVDFSVRVGRRRVAPAAERSAHLDLRPRRRAAPGLRGERSVCDPGDTYRGWPGGRSLASPRDGG